MRAFFLLLILLSTNAQAGIETLISKAQVAGCTITLTHDATPDAEWGTLIYRVYRVEAGVHVPCSLSVEDIRLSLAQALERYAGVSGLKPVESLFIGRLERYSWVAEAFASMPEEDLRAASTFAGFNAWIGTTAVVRPFIEVLTAQAFAVKGVSCEKVLRLPDGRPVDALCWILLEFASTP
ncbi:hypothetical protein OLMES_1299 [Oleiphilus messinensis]|uniref:Uncharacterized protein n=1 Tax=Oleiphilus messinensis TaxID=141451 RepID=A0A1Y0I4E6_9GAMM|nr:hypothetical protein [Oleiphilus messinensis]ARU55378.1 hypothetical protein OLMES_1299 [Oleiphilus messinensis]